MQDTSSFDSLVFNSKVNLEKKYKNVRILIVDDSSSVSGFFTDCLDGVAELFIDETINPSQTKLFVRKNKYDLIVVDYQFGVENIDALLKQKTNFGINTPVIVLITPENEDAAKYDFADCVTGFMMKGDNSQSEAKDLAQKYLMKYIFSSIVLEPKKQIFLNRTKKDIISLSYFKSLDCMMNFVK